ncbi:hypothetical protein ACFL59_14550, partial [Planctomycetota bacterium]
MGLAATDDTVLTKLTRRERPARLMAQVFLESEVKELMDPEVYLASEAGALSNLDLLLGTQGWRRFAFHTPDSFVAEYGDRARRALALRNPPVIRKAQKGFGGGGAVIVFGDDDLAEEGGEVAVGAAVEKQADEVEGLDPCEPEAPEEPMDPADGEPVALAPDDGLVAALPRKEAEVAGKPELARRPRPQPVEPRGERIAGDEPMPVAEEMAFDEEMAEEMAEPEPALVVVRQYAHRAQKGRPPE